MHGGSSGPWTDQTATGAGREARTLVGENENPGERAGESTENGAVERFDGDYQPLGQ